MTAAYTTGAEVADHNFIATDAREQRDLSLLAPLIAGARARGIADAFELTGTAAILLDEVGSILHLGTSAKEFLDGALTVAGDNLLAETAQANRDLERLIAGAVAGRDHLPPVLIARDGATTIEVSAVCIADAVNDGTQLLKAILVLRALPT